MKLEVFRPEDFISTNDLATTQPKEIHEVLKEWQRSFAAKQANTRLNEWLKENTKIIYFQGQPFMHWYTNGKESIMFHDAKDSKCSHPVEKIKCLILHPYTFECECGAKVQPKEFEEIK